MAGVIFAGIELEVDARPDPCGLALHLRTSFLNVSRVEVVSAARWSVYVRADTDTVVLRVENRTRSTGMVRRFPLRLTACEAVADALALVVSRLIRNLGEVAPGLPRLRPSAGVKARTATRSASPSEGFPETLGRRHPAVSARVDLVNPPSTDPPPPSGLRAVRASASLSMPRSRVSIRSPAPRVRDVSSMADLHAVMEVPGVDFGVLRGGAFAWHALESLSHRSKRGIRNAA